MPPAIALSIWLVLLLGLLLFDPAKNSDTSLALWVPLIWMFIVGSRLPSLWIGARYLRVQAQALEEGDPLNRTFFAVLIVLASSILILRSFKWGHFFTRNFALSTFVVFGLMSILWSDFPLVCFKRWFRDLGHYLMILVVLSDPDPLEAVRTVLRRLCYLLLPLSLLLIKYYPELGKLYNDWTGAPEFVGAMTGKNTLGVACLVSGIFFFWDTVTRWSRLKDRKTRRIVIVNVAFIAMTLWLLYLARSATSSVCLVIGCLIIAAAHTKVFGRHPTFLRVLIPASFCLYLILAFGFDMNGDLARSVGRDPTLTTRTFIWKTLLNMQTNPFVGTGYESFWLGPRLQSVWRGPSGRIAEAHNGYLEVYLNLGLIGLILLVGFLISSYRTICRSFATHSSLTSLNLALWGTMLFYNMAEAAFKYHLMWVTFLLAACTVFCKAENQVHGVEAPNASAAEIDRHGMEHLGAVRKARIH
jgi:exopolysaccharide production protein ExoQ